MDSTFSSSSPLLRWLWPIRIWIVVAVVIFAVSLPDPLFDEPRSTVLVSAEGELLSARIADDGQWRFPLVDSVPSMLEHCILTFEDEYFRLHPGVNPFSIARAAVQNWKAGKTVSGGSTITMQVIRLSRDGQARSYAEKLLEVWLALRLEFSFLKDEVLAMYASNAPYGGNVVGVEAASWRYFRRPLHQLSTAEYALLAVLPNAPSLMHPGKNRDALKAKRDRLLVKLHENGHIDQTELELSMLEGIPNQPMPIPTVAHHLMEKAMQSGMTGQRIPSHLNADLQYRLASTVDRYVKHLAQNEIHNACAMVVSIENGQVLAYVGNSSIPETRSPFVDLIQAPRSSGSILKPFLYAMAMEDGFIHRGSLLRDVPIQIGKFAPQNFDRGYQGVVPAGDALAQSLNIPATLLLKKYGLVPFYKRLRSLGFETIDRSAANYGLSLILGGGEVRLIDLCNAYLHQAANLRTACDLPASNGMVLWSDHTLNPPALSIDPGAWFLTTEALCQVNRPGLEQHWRRFSSARQVAWKTGTSHGYRDAWAVGYDRSYLVAVWVGNADGEGRPGLTGTSVAAPLMFEAFSMLEPSPWYCEPEAHLESAEFCKVSGYTAGPHCPTVMRPKPMGAELPNPCEFHRSILVDDAGLRVFRDCAQGAFSDTSWFVLDPVAAHYYQRLHPEYRSLPRLASNCSSNEEHAPLAVIYPSPGAEVFVPRDLDGGLEKLVLQATHHQNDAVLHWHLNDRYLGQTTGDHRLTIAPSAGTHRLKIVDSEGNEAGCRFTAFVED